MDIRPKLGSRVRVVNPMHEGRQYLQGWLGVVEEVHVDDREQYVVVDFGDKRYTMLPGEIEGA